ncbi:MAG: aminotransferase class I/II-fold pyridoxal phosphate-dependent enzyme, partial [Spirochaetes bacterium]|nr:aminotransferase class I/II-fold pyridoxal phosphate-dependent enzyme [Spirochaetota bacterium]
MNMNFNFSQIALKMKASKIRELMKFASMPGVISFGGGMPDPQSFPFDDVKSIIETWDKKKAMTAMQYGPTPGYPALIDILKKRMIEKKNINMSDQELIITTGAQQAIFLMSRIFIDTDDIIIVEQPSFIGAIAAFVSNEAKLMGVPLQEDGVDVEYLEDLLKKLKSQGKKVKFFYTI